jgi:hypothetical protein
MAGKNPTPENIHNIREKWGFDKPFYVQYARMMQKAANGLTPGPHSEYDILRSFDTRQDVRARDREGHPGHDVALHRRRDHLALLRHRRGRDLCGDGRHGF